MKSNILSRTLVIAAATAALAAPSQAFLWTWSATLSGINEVPPNASPGLGTINGTMDDVTGQVIVLAGSYASMTGTVSAAHIHGLAPAGANAGVIMALTTTGGTSGTLGGSGFLTPAQVTGMIGGLTYVNVHSSTFPGGEIRGQIEAVPEPSSVAAILGGGALLLLRRRRR